MPTIERNRRRWDSERAWESGGDEWSATWGGPEPQWREAILPRIRDFLPARHILEIAPGHGRWTRFLADQCDTLTLVDLSERCIAVCRKRFEGRGHVRFVVNDGSSLPTVADGSIDLAFSFDSLVHAEMPALDGYLRELARVLTGDGVAFLHHSNLAAYGPPGLARRTLPDGLCMALMARGILVCDHWRAYSVSAELVRDSAALAGVPCVRQELINWGGDRLIDCLSTFTPRGSRWERATELITNTGFMAEADAIRRRAAARAAGAT